MTLIEGSARELLDAGPDALIVADSDDTIVYVNDHTETLFGYTSEELIGKQLEMLLLERFRTAHPGLRLSYVQNPRLRPMGENREVYAQHRDGSEFRVEIRLSVLQTDQGPLVSSTIRDVTVRRDLSLTTSLRRQTLDPILLPIGFTRGDSVLRVGKRRQVA
jgi:PAS domain S-box-containing protein